MVLFGFDLISKSFAKALTGLCTGYWVLGKYSIVVSRSRPAIHEQGQLSEMTQEGNIFARKMTNRAIYLSVQGKLLTQ